VLYARAGAHLVLIERHHCCSGWADGTVLLARLLGGHEGAVLCRHAHVHSICLATAAAPFSVGR